MYEGQNFLRRFAPTDARLPMASTGDAIGSRQWFLSAAEGDRARVGVTFRRCCATCHTISHTQKLRSPPLLTRGNYPGQFSQIPTLRTN